MSNELLARAMSLIQKAADIHKATDEYYITVSVGRNDADVHITFFEDGDIEKREAITYCSGEREDGEYIVADPGLEKAAERIEKIWRAVNG